MRAKNHLMREEHIMVNDEGCRIEKGRLSPQKDIGVYWRKIKNREKIFQIKR
ncbi:hypothetical protein MHK_006543 [Candidatus Magnetomorum sp. HK-1]|nr:hypothetical protein MHK_006543 [Candidatus Magnetomorum sp. HK-1]